MSLSIFTKILLLLLAIFIGLTYYAYGMFQKEKEVIANKKIIMAVNTPIPHPPLSDKKERNKTDKIASEENLSKENLNKEYLSEKKLSEETRDVFDEKKELIPKHEIDNYPIAQTIPLSQEEEIPPQSSINEDIYSIKDGETDPF